MQRIPKRIPCGAWDPEQKMAPHGLTFGEHCVDLEKKE
jgi:hypothetical protein